MELDTNLLSFVFCYIFEEHLLDAKSALILSGTLPICAGPVWAAQQTHNDGAVLACKWMRWIMWGVFMETNGNMANRCALWVMENVGDKVLDLFGLDMPLLYNYIVTHSGIHTRLAESLPVSYKQLVCDIEYDLKTEACEYNALDGYKALHSDVTSGYGENPTNAIYATDEWRNLDINEILVSCLEREKWATKCVYANMVHLVTALTYKSKDVAIEIFSRFRRYSTLGCCEICKFANVKTMDMYVVLRKILGLTFLSLDKNLMSACLSSSFACPCMNMHSPVVQHNRVVPKYTGEYMLRLKRRIWEAKVIDEGWEFAPVGWVELFDTDPVLKQRFNDEFAHTTDDLEMAIQMDTDTLATILQFIEHNLFDQGIWSMEFVQYDEWLEILKPYMMVYPYVVKRMILLEYDPSQSQFGLQKWKTNL